LLKISERSMQEHSDLRRKLVRTRWRRWGGRRRRRKKRRRGNVRALATVERL